MQKEIKLFKGTTALIQFKQRELIDKIIENLSTNKSKDMMVEERITAIRGGICYMLSVEWLRRIYADNGKWNTFCFHQLNDEGNIILTSSDLAYYTQIANNYFTYSKLFDDSTKTTLQAALLGTEIEHCSYFQIDEKLVPLCLEKKEGFHIQVQKAIEPQFNIDTLKRDLQAYLKSHADSKLLVGLRGSYLADSSTVKYFGHKTAMYRNADGIYFYDPNFGLYQVNDLGDFLQDLWDTYHTVLVRITEVNYHPVQP